VSTALVDHCLELLAPLGAVRSRRMFGGHGLYIDDLFVALIAFDRLYMKTDLQTRPRFQAAGGEPFVYDVKRGAVALGYWTVPAEAMESPALMQPWARQAIEAALRARAAKASAAPRKPRAAKPKAVPAASRRSR
jgi:DNA transformation protein